MRNIQTGFTLIELVISVALLAILFTSVGAAVSASLHCATENTDLAALTQSARSVLNRMARDIRTAAAVDAEYDTITIIPPAGSEAELIQYHYDAEQGVLYYRPTIGGETNSYALMGGSGAEVQPVSCYFSYQLGQDYQGTECTKSVTVSLEIQAGANRRTVTASASPRRNQIY